MKSSVGRAVAASSLLLVFCACSPSESTFQREAEKTIESDDGEKLPKDVDDATCTEPASTEPETTFACEAIDADGQVHTFTARITADNAFEVFPNG